LTQRRGSLDGGFYPCEAQSDFWPGQVNGGNG
jgi:hypothetical protein